jgi:hypothetical protein
LLIIAWATCLSPPWWPSVNGASAHQCFWVEEFWELLGLSLVSVLIEVVKDEIICG